MFCKGIEEEGRGVYRGSGCAAQSDRFLVAIEGPDLHFALGRNFYRSLFYFLFSFPIMISISMSFSLSISFSFRFRFRFQLVFDFDFDSDFVFEIVFAFDFDFVLGFDFVFDLFRSFRRLICHGLLTGAQCTLE